MSLGNSSDSSAAAGRIAGPVCWRHAWIFRIAVAGMLAIGGTRAHAAVSQLTGGDPTGGLTLTPANVVDALYTPSGTQTQVWQGVTFSATLPNITRNTGNLYLGPSTADTGTTSGNAGFTDASNTTQDTNLLALMNAGLDFNSATGPTSETVTITGLADNTAYQIDSLISLLGYTGGRTDTVAYNGGSVSDTITYGPATLNGIYDVEDRVTSTATGTIVVDYSGNAGPFYSALVVSTPTAATLTWTGGGGSAGSGSWNTTSATTNWNLTASPFTPTAYADPDKVTFDDTGANTNITIQATGVNPGSVTFNNFSNTYTFTNASSGTVGIGGGATLTINGNSNGGGTVNLNAPNSYTGGTLVNNGTLNVGNSSGSATGTGAVTVGDQVSGHTAFLSGAGTISGPVTINGPGGSGIAATIAGTSGSTLSLTGGLTLNTGSISSFTLTTAARALIATSGGSGASFNIAGASTINLASVTHTGTFELYSYTGVSGFANLTLGSLPAGYSYQLLNNGNQSQVDLVVTATNNPPYTLFWTGATTAWSTSAGNWVTSTGATPGYADTDTVTLGDTYPPSSTGVGSSGTVVIGNGGVSPATVSFTNSTVSYSLSDLDNANGILGSAIISKSGAGSVTFTSPNGFSGLVSIGAGQFILQNGAAMGSSAGVTVSSGAALQLQHGITAGNVALSITGAGLAAAPAGALESGSDNTSDTYSGNISIGVPGATITSATSPNTLTLTGGVTTNGNLVTVNGAGNTTITTTGITGGGGVVYSGTGTLTLNASNNYTGGTAVQNGTLILGTGGSLATTGALTLGNSTGNTSGIFQLGDSSNPVSQTVSSLTTSGTGSANAVVGGNSAVSTLTVSASGADTFAGTLGGAGNGNNLALTMSGAGTLTLSGTNTYTGATTLNSSGTLSLTGTLGSCGGTAISSAGTFNESGAGVIAGTSSISVTGGTTTLAGANTYTGGTTLSAGTLSIGANSTPTSGTVTSGPVGTGTLTLSGGSLTNSGGTWTIANNVNVTGTTTVYAGGTGNFSLTGAISGGGTLQDNLQNEDESLTISGNLSGFTGTIFYADTNNTVNNLNISTSTNAEQATLSLTGSSGLARALNLTNLQLGALTGTGGTVNVNGTLTVGYLNSSTTFAGAIGGSGSALTEVGTGTLTLSGTNTYTGGTTIQAGTVLIGVSNATTVSGALGPSADGVTLGNSSGSTSASLLTNGAFTFSNPVTVASGSSANTLALGGNTANTSTFSGVITLDNNLTISQIASGTTNLTGNIRPGAPGTQTLTFNNAGSVSQSTGVIGVGTGAIALVQSGAGTTTLAGVNTYTGGTAVNAGTLAISGSGTLGAATGGLTLGGGTLSLGTTSQTVGAVSITAAASGNTIQNGSLTATSFAASNSSGDAIITANLLGSGAGLTMSGSGALTLSGANNTYSGTTAATAGTLSLTGSLTGSNVATSSTGVFSETSTGMVAGAASFTQGSSGTSTLAGVNTYTVATNVNAGTLDVTGSGTLGNSGSSALNMGGGTLDLGTTTQTVGAVSITAAAAGGNTIENGSLTATSFAASSSSGNAIITANLLGSGAGLTMSGSGTLTLSGANSYTGGTAVDAGTLAISGSGTLGATTGSLTLGGGTLDLGTTSQTAGAVTITSAAASGNTIQNGSLAATSFAASNSSGNAIITANLAGLGAGLTMSGSGTLTLSGANSYSGTTNINSGTLRISNPTGSATGGGPVNITGGTLAGGIASPGAITGTVSVASGGTIAPSDGNGVSGGLGSVGTLTVGGLTLNSTGGAVLNYQAANLSNSSDLIAVNSPLALPTSGTTTFNFYSIGTNGAYTFVGGDAYNLISDSSITHGGANLNSIFSIGTGTVPGGYQATFSTTADPGYLALVISSSNASAAWSSNSSGSFDTPTNWTGSTIPSGVGLIATFDNGGLSGPISVGVGTQTGTDTVGSLVFNNASSSASYVLTGGTLALNNAGNSGGASVNVSSGANPTLDSSLTLSLADSSLTTTFNVAGGASLDVAGTINQSLSNETIVLNGGGILKLDGAANAYTGGTTVNSGTLIADGSGISTLGSGPLTINGSTSAVAINTSQAVGSLSSTSTGGQLNVASFATLTVNQSTSGTFAGTLSLGMNGGLVLQQASGNTLTISGASSLSSGSTIAVNSGTLALTNNTGIPASIASTATVSVAPGATLQLASTSAVLSSTVNITTQGSGTSGDGALSVVGTTTQTVGVISGNTLGGSVTTYAGNTTVGDGTNAANLTATQILQNTLTINAGSTVTIAPSGPGIETDAQGSGVGGQGSEAVSGVALAAGSSDVSSDSASDPFTAIQAAIASGSISSVKGEQLENRIAAIERLAATDPGLDVSLLEDRVLAALPAPSVWSSSGSSPLVETGSGLLAVDSSTIGSSSDATSGSATASFAPAADFGGSPAAVPEPSALLLAAMGGIGMALAIRRRTIHRNGGTG